MIELKTDRLILRRWKESDAEALFRYASDPELGPLAGWPPHKSVEESREVIRSVFCNDRTWAVKMNATGEPIGCVGYLTASASNLQIGSNDAEVGYWIARPHWGKGFCTEAMLMVVDFCFYGKGFDSLWGCFFPSNQASGRVMEKCGFRDTGQTTLCPNLLLGSNLPVKVMKLPNPMKTICAVVPGAVGACSHTCQDVREDV